VQDDSRLVRCGHVPSPSVARGVPRIRARLPEGLGQGAARSLADETECGRVHGGATAAGRRTGPRRPRASEGHPAPGPRPGVGGGGARGAVVPGGVPGGGPGGTRSRSTSRRPRQPQRRVQRRQPCSAAGSSPGQRAARSEHGGRACRAARGTAGDSTAFITMASTPMTAVCSDRVASPV
jgi:hypothetical protein